MIKFQSVFCCELFSTTSAFVLPARQLERSAQLLIGKCQFNLIRKRSLALNILESRIVSQRANTKTNKSASFFVASTQLKKNCLY